MYELREKGFLKNGLDGFWRAVRCPKRYKRTTHNGYTRMKKIGEITLSSLQFMRRRRRLRDERIVPS
jgi:hypothetical protein